MRGVVAAMAMEEPWSFTVDTNKRSQSKRVRFNLLALDHGEYYFQDYSAYFYPSTSGNAAAAAAAAVAAAPAAASHHPRSRQQGRLKLCSRGLLFEPADRLLPLVKYPFRHMETQMERVGGVSGGWTDAADVRRGGGRGTEGFRFRCTVVVESRRNDEVGPYVTKKAGGSGAAGEWSDWTFSFSLLHTPLGDFLVEARRLREVALRVKERGHGYEEPLLRPLLEERLRDSTWKFDTIHLVDFRETLLLPCPVRVDRITPLLRNPGCIMVTDARVYFQPAELNNVGEPVASFALPGVLRAFKRRHMLRQTGLELFMAGDGGSAFFNFESSAERDELFDVLMSQPLVGPRAQSARDIKKETRKWQAGQVSNYDYLVFLNTVAGRTVNDLTQYPVFPWVLQDFESSTLNLDDPSVYRDLSRPIGALGANRLEYFRARLRNMPDPALHPDSGLPPPFLYGTHYSTPGYALFFLVRAAPEEMLCLQNGRFDDPDRSFTSVKGAWDSVLKNHADLKELIPEFYAGDGSFLTNRDDLPLGVTQSGQRVGDVELPPWARNPRDFVRKMRRALESPHVSRRLHLWIDLIFGCRQRGRAAIESDNLFYYLTYEGAVDLEKVDDPRERAALESQISEFGQCPSQLFRGPHPRRDATSAPVILQNPMYTSAFVDQRGDGVGEFGVEASRNSTEDVYKAAYAGQNVRGEWSVEGQQGGYGLPERGIEDHIVGTSSVSSFSGIGIAHGSNNSNGSASNDSYDYHQKQQYQRQQQEQDGQFLQPQEQKPFWTASGGDSRGTRSPSPPPLGSRLHHQHHQHPSTSVVGMSVGSAVGNSVGALWKRGWAMAGAVSGAAVEAAGARGGLRTAQRWPGTAAGGRGVGVEERQGNSDLGVSGVRSLMQPGVAKRLTDDHALQLEVEQLERARSGSASSIHKYDPNNISTTINKYPVNTHDLGHQESLHADPNDQGTATSRGFRAEEAGLLSLAGDPLHQKQTVLDAHQGSSGQMLSLTTARGKSGASAVALPPALAMATGCRLWGINAAKIDLRPGEPLVLHRDGVTCLRLVMSGSRSERQKQLREVTDESRLPCPSYEGDNALEGSSGAFLTLCTSSKDCSLKICSLEREAGGSGPVSKGYTRRRLAGGELPLSCCALTSDEKHAVAGSWDNGLLLYSVQAAAVLSKVEGAHEDGVRCLALHEGLALGNGNGGTAERRTLLASGSWDAAVKVWEIRASDMHIDPNAVLELFDLEAAVQTVAFDGTGKLLAAGSEDGMVAVWDVSTGSLVATFSGFVEQSPVISMHWTSNCSSSGSSSANSKYGGNDLSGGEGVRSGNSLRSLSSGCVGSACLLLASEAGDICRYSPLGARLGTLRLDSEVAAMDSDGRCTVVACKDASLRLLSSLDDGGFVQTLVRESGHEEDMTCLHVSASSSITSNPNHSSSSNNNNSGGGVLGQANDVVIVIGSEGGTVRVWDVVHRSRA